MIETIKAKLAGSRKSLTIWFNGLAGMLAIALPFAQGALPEMQAYLPANVYQWLMATVVLGNIILRFKTVSDLAHK